MRPDKRVQTAIRQMSLSQATMKRSDGSAKFSFGNSTVLCAVLGPTAAKTRDELMEKAFIKINFTPLAGIGGTNDRLYESILKNICEPLILVSLYPRTMIKITLQVLAIDGGILSAAINAMILALMDAGVPMKSTCSAITVMVHKDGLLLLDPTALELESSQSVHTFAFDNNDDRCLVAISNGCFTQEEYDSCYDLALLATKSVSNFIKTGVSKRLEKYRP